MHGLGLILCTVLSQCVRRNLHQRAGHLQKSSKKPGLCLIYFCNASCAIMLQSLSYWLHPVWLTVQRGTARY